MSLPLKPAACWVLVGVNASPRTLLTMRKADLQTFQRVPTCQSSTESAENLFFRVAFRERKRKKVARSFQAAKCQPRFVRDEFVGLDFLKQPLFKEKSGLARKPFRYSFVYKLVEKRDRELLH
jgi:hypothetical protein